MAERGDLWELLKAALNKFPAPNAALGASDAARTPPSASGVAPSPNLANGDSLATPPPPPADAQDGIVSNSGLDGSGAPVAAPPVPAPLLPNGSDPTAAPNNEPEGAAAAAPEPVASPFAAPSDVVKGAVAATADPNKDPEGAEADVANAAEVNNDPLDAIAAEKDAPDPKVPAPSGADTGAWSPAGDAGFTGLLPESGVAGAAAGLEPSGVSSSRLPAGFLLGGQFCASEASEASTAASRDRFDIV